MPNPQLGYGKPTEATIDQVNQWMRSSPWYHDLLRSWGQNPASVHLNDMQKHEIMRAAQAQGVVVDEGDMEVDPSGNFNPKGHKLRNTLIVAGIAGATIATMGAAGVFSGAGAGGAGMAGGASGAGAAGAGGAGAAGLGAGTLFAGTGAGAAGAGAGAALGSTAVGTGMLGGIAGGTGMSAGGGAAAAGGAASTAASTIAGRTAGQTAAHYGAQAVPAALSILGSRFGGGGGSGSGGNDEISNLMRQFPQLGQLLDLQTTQAQRQDPLHEALTKLGMNLSAKADWSPSSGSFDPIQQHKLPR